MTGPLVIGVEEPGAAGVSWRVFDRPFVVVGRDAGADLVLQDPALSRRHAYLQAIAGRLFCVDLCSRTGTHWGAEPGLWGWVDAERGVRIGPYTIRSREGAAALALGSSVVGSPAWSNLPVPVSRSFEQPELADLALEVEGPASGPTTWQASRALILIGRSRSCKIRLDGPIAEIHAAILRTPAGAFAIDLLGPGGILVNGRRVRWARLDPGDELKVGVHAIRARGGRASGGVPAARRGPAPAVDRRSGGASDDLGPLLGMMLDKFALRQEQASDRSRVDLMAVVQAVAAMHQDQMALIREELGCLRAVAEEQAALRLKVEGQARAIAGPPALRLVSGGPAEATVRPPSGISARRPTDLTIGADDRRPSRPTPAPTTPPPATGPARTPLPRVAPAEEGAFHARLFDRLAEIQGERQGRWQKLVDSLLGKAH